MAGITNVFIDDATLNCDDEVADMPAMVKAYKRQITLGQFSQDLLSDAHGLLAP